MTVSVTESSSPCRGLLVAPHAAVGGCRQLAMLRGRVLSSSSTPEGNRFKESLQILNIIKRHFQY